MSEEERYTKVIDIWNNHHRRTLRNMILPGLDKFNPIRMMTDSGARGSIGAGLASWPACAA